MKIFFIVCFTFIISVCPSYGQTKDELTNQEYETIHSSITQINRKLYELDSIISSLNLGNNYGINKLEIEQDLKKLNENLKDKFNVVAHKYKKDLEILLENNKKELLGILDDRKKELVNLELKNKQDLELLEQKAKSEIVQLDQRVNQLIDVKLTSIEEQLEKVEKNKNSNLKLNAEKILELEKNVSAIKREIIDFSSKFDKSESENLIQFKNLNSDKDSLNNSLKILLSKTDELASNLSVQKEYVSKRDAKNLSDFRFSRNLEYTLFAIVMFLLALIIWIKVSCNKTVQVLNKRISLLQTDALNSISELDLKVVKILEGYVLNRSEHMQSSNNDVDHSLMLKISDEIARMETNLSKMDKGVKGYKQLVKSLDRIKESALNNGYEIINLIGQEYNDGMICDAQFVDDDEIPEGKAIITGMLKMQVNYKGKLIQLPKIIVSKNIL